MKLFSDLENEFQILDYVPTHAQLLLRNMQNRNRKFNIDIIIKPVYAMILPTNIKGLEIFAEELNEKNNFLVEQYGFNVGKDCTVFRITNADNKNYYVIGMAMGVFHNSRDILETSIGTFYRSEEHGQKLFWYSGK